MKFKAIGVECLVWRLSSQWNIHHTQQGTWFKSQICSWLFLLSTQVGDWNDFLAPGSSVAQPWPVWILSLSSNISSSSSLSCSLSRSLSLLFAVHPPPCPSKCFFFNFSNKGCFLCARNFWNQYSFFTQNFPQAVKDPSYAWISSFCFCRINLSCNSVFWSTLVYTTHKLSFNS